MDNIEGFYNQAIFSVLQCLHFYKSFSQKNQNLNFERGMLNPMVDIDYF
jgi:hypothetical protein